VANLISDAKKTENPHWQVWDQNLQRWGVKDFAAAFLESAGPMNIFLAQVIHVANPFLRLAGFARQWDELADMLEDRQQSSNFVSFLRGKEKA